MTYPITGPGIFTLAGLLAISTSSFGVEDDEKSTPSRGIVYSAEIEGRAFDPGEPIELSPCFENPTDREVTIWLSGFWPNHRVVLTDGSGDEPPLTELGKERRAAFAPGGPRGKNAPRVLPPGERYCDHEGIDLTDMYQIEKGRYRARIIYHDLQGPTPLRVVSEAVEFEVE